MTPRGPFPLIDARVSSSSGPEQTRPVSPDNSDSSDRFVALLRGINVGGRNKVPMAELRSALTERGLSDVRTYIQSGNVVFGSDLEPAGLEVLVADVVRSSFGVESPTVVRSAADMRAVVESAPSGFGAEPDSYHYDVIFLKDPLTAPDAMAVVKVRDGVDRAWEGTGCLYFARLSARRTQSRLSSIMGTPEYELMTIRNWRTVSTLTGMVGRSEADGSDGSTSC